MARAEVTGKKLATTDPIFVSIKEAARLTAESEWKVKQCLREGIYEGVKSGRRTLVKYATVKRRAECLPAAKFLPPTCRPIAGRTPREAQQAE
jgi:hypothetical protein